MHIGIFLTDLTPIAPRQQAALFMSDVGIAFEDRPQLLIVSMARAELDAGRRVAGRESGFIKKSGDLLGQGRGANIRMASASKSGRPSSIARLMKRGRR